MPANKYDAELTVAAMHVSYFNDPPLLTDYGVVLAVTLVVAMAIKETSESMLYCETQSSSPLAKQA